MAVGPVVAPEEDKAGALLREEALKAAARQEVVRPVKEAQEAALPSQAWASRAEAQASRAVAERRVAVPEEAARAAVRPAKAEEAGCLIPAWASRAEELVSAATGRRWAAAGA
jgi:hypothetical protein